MRVGIVTFGTRGDVQPFVALGLGLRAAGLDVCIGTPENLRGLAEDAGLAWRPTFGDTQAVLSTPRARRWLARGWSLPVQALLYRALREQRSRVQEGVHDVCREADLVVAHFGMEELAGAEAERRGLPLVRAETHPTRETGAFPLPTWHLPGGTPALARATYRVYHRVRWWAFRGEVARLRERYGGAPGTKGSVVHRLDRARRPVLGAYSPTLAPPPPDWGPERLVTGFWEWPREAGAPAPAERLSPELLGWLEEGPPPVFLGFGSMPLARPERALALAARAASGAGARLVISFAAGERPERAGRLGRELYVAGPVDHDALLPRCAAAVHHAGPGTVASCLRAGVPSVACPFWVDQPFWARRLEALGAGVALPFPRMSERRLRGALLRLRAPAFAKRARELGERLRAEHGLTRAVTALRAEMGAQAPTQHGGTARTGFLESDGGSRVEGRYPST